MQITYALIDVLGEKLFVATADGKVVYATFVDEDSSLGVDGSYCVANQAMSIGVERLEEFLRGSSVNIDALKPDYGVVKRVFDLALSGVEEGGGEYLLLGGTEFQKKVWQSLLTIKHGQVVGYVDVAKAIGNRKAVRAVASAIAKNNIAYLIPCHRVVCADGSVGGYRWGQGVKRRLLSAEKQKSS